MFIGRGLEKNTEEINYVFIFHRHIEQNSNLVTANNSLEYVIKHKYSAIIKRNKICIRKIRGSPVLSEIKQNIMYIQP
jgi:hypothetical protein